MEQHIRNTTDSKAMSENEKKQLKIRILSSVKNRKIKKERLKYGIAMAASITLFLASGLYFKHKKETSITDFVKSTANLQNINSGKITLRLIKGENVSLDEDDPTITYSTSGKNVNVGHSKSLSQEIKHNDETAYNTLVVPYGKRSKIQLSDGSTVWINSGSRLTFPAVFNGKTREVYIEGEAIFEVTHNKQKPFMVLSENQEIKVLGTVFNVNNYADEDSAFTVLKSGSVEIRYGKNNTKTDNNNLKISPGTLASYDKKAKSMVSEIVDVDRYFSWREGVLIFRNDDLRTIMRRLSRYYNLDIAIKNEKLANQTFSGHLDLKEDVEKVIGAIKKTTDFNYSRTGDKTITITK